MPRSAEWASAAIVGIDGCGPDSIPASDHGPNGECWVGDSACEHGATRPTSYSVRVPIHAAAAIMMIALISGCVNTDDPVQRKLDDGVFLRHTWPIRVMPALPVMPEFEPVGERWYLTTD